DTRLARSPTRFNDAVMPHRLARRLGKPAMEIPPPDLERRATPSLPRDAVEAPQATAKKLPDVSGRLPSIIVGVVMAGGAGLWLWYLVRPQPLLVQGEVDASRLDIAARVDGRVAELPVIRGQDVAAGAVLVRIDNPETIAKHDQALAARIVAEAQL